MYAYCFAQNVNLFLSQNEHFLVKYNTSQFGPFGLIWSCALIDLYTSKQCAYQILCICLEHQCGQYGKRHYRRVNDQVVFILNHRFSQSGPFAFINFKSLILCLLGPVHLFGLSECQYGTRQTCQWSSSNYPQSPSQSVWTRFDQTVVPIQFLNFSSFKQYVLRE